ncbi:MAG: hypothetical protein ACOC33_03550 [bacterium]
MDNKLISIIQQEVSELFDPNFGNLYEPKGLDPTHVKLFETYKSIDEIKKLATRIIDKIAEENYEYYNEKGKFNFLYGTYLKSIDSSKFDDLKEFIENANISITVQPKKNDSHKGDYGTYPDGKYNPRDERDITIYVDYGLLEERINEKLKERNNNMTQSDLFNILFYSLYTTLIHELQHAYDDYRSGGKALQTKEFKKYIQDKTRDKINSDLESAKKYLNLPHEIWARFTQAVDRISFYEADYEKDKYGFQFKMVPLKKLAKDFARKFDGFSILSDKMKRKLINKIVQFWHYEKEKLPALNKEFDF